MQISELSLQCFICSVTNVTNVVRTHLNKKPQGHQTWYNSIC